MAHAHGACAHAPMPTPTCPCPCFCPRAQRPCPRAHLGRIRHEVSLIKRRQRQRLCIAIGRRLAAAPPAHPTRSAAHPVSWMAQTHAPMPTCPHACMHTCCMPMRPICLPHAHPPDEPALRRLPLPAQEEEDRREHTSKHRPRKAQASDGRRGERRRRRAAGRGRRDCMRIITCGARGGRCGVMLRHSPATVVVWPLG